MKTKLLVFATTILMATNLQAQAPEKFNYQGIARDNTGAPLANQNLGIQISILNSSNTALYVEQHTETTNDFGLYTLQIGDGTPITGTMGGVNWAGNTKKIKVEIDPNGGTNYTDLGTTELLSVPYALYAKESLWEQNGNAIFYDEGNVGIGTDSPIGMMNITGTMGSDDFVTINPTSGLGGGYDLLQLTAPASATNFDYIQMGTSGSDLVFEVQESGAVVSVSNISAAAFESNPTSLTTPGLILNESGSTDNWALTHASTDNLWFEYNGSLTSWIEPSGNYNTSDRRLKKNIVPMESVLDKVEKIKIMHYSMKADENNEILIGFIAQELLNQFPEVVSRAGKNEEGINYYGVNYGAMSAVAIKAIQEQQKIIENLQKQVAELKKMVKD